MHHLTCTRCERPFRPKSFLQDGNPQPTTTMSGDFLNAMAQPPVQANLDATKPRVVTLTEESLLADVSKIAKEAPSAVRARAAVRGPSRAHRSADYPANDYLAFIASTGGDESRSSSVARDGPTAVWAGFVHGRSVSPSRGGVRTASDAIRCSRVRNAPRTIRRRRRDASKGTRRSRGAAAMHRKDAAQPRRRRDASKEAA